MTGGRGAPECRTLRHRMTDSDQTGDLYDELFGGGGDRPENERRQRKILGDLLRRAVDNAVGSVQNTGSVGKEAFSFLLQQGDKGKKEVVRIVAKEVGDFLRGVDLASEVAKVLTSVQVDVQASVKFRPSEGGHIPKPDIKVSMDGARLDDDEPSPSGA